MATAYFLLAVGWVVSGVTDRASLTGLGVTEWQRLAFWLWGLVSGVTDRVALMGL